MGQYALLHYGYETPTPEIMKAWGEWFASIGARIVENIGPFGTGREITPSGTRELPHGLEAITGLTIINAESVDEAVSVAQACPMITGIRVYELMSM